MSSLDKVVIVNITRATKVPTRQGFGKGAFVSEGAVFPELVRAYSSTDAVNEDFALGLVDQRVVDAANKHFSQAEKTTEFFVIKKGADRAHVQLITFVGDFVTGNIINMNVNAAPVGPVNFITDTDTTLAALATAIQGEAGVATAVANSATRSILVTGAAVNVEVVLTTPVVTGGAAQTTGAISLVTYFDEVQTYVESITRARAVNDDWYIIMIQSKDKANQEPVADYIEPLIKLFAYSTSDANAKNAALATDILSLLMAKGYDRSFGIYHEDDTADAEMGWTGGQLPKNAGASTWAEKEIKGIVKSELTDTEYNAILGKNGSVYVDVGGLGMTQFGTVASGEYIDVMRGVDYMHVEIQAGIVTLKANSDKVPYTNKGIGLIQSEVETVLEQSSTEERPIITKEYSVSVPAAADVNIADKAARELKGVTFEGILQGAIHKTFVSGNVSL